MQNMPDFSDVMRLLQTPEGQRLLSILQSADSHVISAAISSAKAGDYEAAKKALSGVLSTPEAQALIDQLGR